MRRPVAVAVAIVGVLVVGMVALVALESRERDVLPHSDVPSARNGAALSVSPRVATPEFHVTVAINAGSGLTYGQSYEIDKYVNGTWRYILIGGQPPPGNPAVSRPSPRDQEPIFTAEVFSGPSSFKLSVAEGPGDYRIRKAFIDEGPGEDFELAATFRLSAASQ